MNKDYRSFSFWLDTTDDDLSPRPSLGGDSQFDVAIVGGGFTGLWTAYYLLAADPSLRICVVERDICGFGASGRNGGWASSFFAGSRERAAKLHGRRAAIALQRAMFNAVDEITRVATAEGIDCHYHKGGALALVTSPVPRSMIGCMWRTRASSRNSSNRPRTARSRKWPLPST